MIELDIRRYCYAHALEHLHYVFQIQIMHQILYAFVFYIRVCERYLVATSTMLFQFLACKHVAYRPRPYSVFLKLGMLTGTRVPGTRFSYPNPGN